MARRRILARLWELIGPPRVTRAEAVAIAMAEFERIGRGPGERLSISRWLGTWTVVINPPSVRGGAGRRSTSTATRARYAAWGALTVDSSAGAAVQWLD